MKLNKTKIIAICVLIAVAFVSLIAIGSLLGKRKPQQQITTEAVKTVFSQSQKKHVALQYPIEDEQDGNTVATLKNLSTGEILTDETYEKAFGFLLDENGKYLATISSNGKVLSEHIVEITEGVSFYHIRMQND